jgi:hypothetical protein
VWLALAAIRLFEAKGFSGLALRAALQFKRRRPHVDSCRRGSDSRPHRLLDPSACDPALLRNPSLSKPKQVQSRSRQTRLALSNWAKPQGSVRRPLPSHAPASRGTRQATRKGKFPEGGPISIRQPLKRRREARWHLPRNRTTGAWAQSSVIRTATTNKSKHLARGSVFNRGLRRKCANCERSIGRRQLRARRRDQSRI